jgi:hypothetical protein
MGVSMSARLEQVDGAAIIWFPEEQVAGAR